jgi:alpha-galactosidase
VTNRDLIAINQDALGIQAAVEQLPDGSYRLVKRLADGSQAIALFNGTPAAIRTVVDWKTLSAHPASQHTDLWSHETKAVSGPYSVTLAPDETKVWRLH